MSNGGVIAVALRTLHYELQRLKESLPRGLPRLPSWAIHAAAGNGQPPMS